MQVVLSLYLLKLTLRKGCRSVEQERDAPFQAKRAGDSLHDGLFGQVTHPNLHIML